MAEETFDPTGGPPPAPVRRTHVDRVPGQRDMSLFERAFAGASADGPRVQWTVRWPDGRATVVDSEDDALALALAGTGCRITRRYVTACVPR